MNSYLIVFFGAGVGGALRHAVNTLSMRIVGPGFPAGTMMVNIAGSLAMGIIIGWLAYKGEAAQPWRLFLTTGLLGGFTTFSAFSLDVALLYERGQYALLALYAGGSVLISIAALALGLWVVRTQLA